MRRLFFCSADGLMILRSEIFADDMLVPTNVGSKRADMLIGSTKASLTLPGAVNASGDVTFTAKHGGSSGNSIFVGYEIGETGAVHLSRSLAVAVDLQDEDGISVLVTFGTTGAGFTITPTAQHVADVMNADPAVQDILVATPNGTGDVGAIDPTYFIGGADDGDWRKFNVKNGTCLRINTIEVI